MNKKVSKILTYSVAGAVLVGALVYYNFIDNKETSTMRQPGDSLDVNNLTIAYNGTGTWSYTNFIGKPVIMNFWATWCGPCVAELPYFSEVKNIYQDQVEIVAVHQAGKSVKAVNDFIDSHLDEPSITFAIDDEEKIYHDVFCASSSWPVTVFVDKEGKIDEILVGSSTVDSLTIKINSLLN